MRFLIGSTTIYGNKILGANIMAKDLKTLLEKAVLSEETKEAISTAWTAKVEQVREETATELRQEFSSRFEHDKNSIVEAMDQFLTDHLGKEIKSLVESQKKVAQERVALTKKGETINEKFEKFMLTALSKELSEFSANRKAFVESINKAEKFIVSHLAEEIKEYEDCKNKLIEERVSVQAEKTKEINEAKKRFIEQASLVAEQVISESIKAEFTELRENLAEARKQTFGRKIFESFAAEFGSNFFSESSEIKKIASKVKALETQLSEAKNQVSAKASELTESQNQVKVAQELLERNTVMSDLLTSLSKDKRAVMRKMLESVDTRKLRENYKKFLPAVLNTFEGNREDLSTKTELVENNTATVAKRVVDGNRKVIVEKEEIAEIQDLLRLSGRV